jgi:hypothetical protein
MDMIFDIVSQDRLLGKLAKHHRVLRTLRDNSDSLLGQLHKNIHIVDVRDDTLLFETSNPIWVSEIKRYEKMILGRVNSLLYSKLAKESPTISRIKVIISLKKVITKPPVTDGSSVEDKPVDLEALVAAENRKKLAKGFMLCRSCSDILTDEDICVFCRSLGKS